MSLRGVPDWHLPLPAGGCFAAYEQPDVWFTVPTTLEPEPGGYVVDRFAIDPASGPVTRFGVHTLRWEAVHDTAVAVPGATLPPTQPRPVPLDGGVARLTGPAHLVDPDGAPALGLSLPLDQAGLSTFAAVVTLDDTSTELALAAHNAGTALIGVDVVLSARGVAARHPATVEVDPARFAAALPGPVVEVDDLRDQLVTAPDTLGIRILAGAPADDPDRARLADALLDRILARLAVPEPPAAREPEAIALGARLPVRLRIDAPATGILRWDLTQPLLSPRLFSMASAGLVLGAPPAEVHDHAPPTLSSGWHEVRVSAALVPPWAGAFIGFDIQVPPRPPARPQPVRVSRLLDGVSDATVPLRLTPAEPLSGSVTGTVVFDSGDQATGAPVPLDRPAVTLRSDAFAARFLPLGRTADLADCELTVDWYPDPAAAAPAAASAVLGRGAERSTLVVPDTAEASLRVTAVAADGSVAVSPPLACRPLLIDPFLFPGTGARTVDVVADFDANSPPSIAVELVAEGREDDPTASALLHLARGTPRAQWGRFVGSPFVTGYRWRPAGGGAWSDPRTDDTLTVPAAGTSIREDTMTGDGEERAAGIRLLQTDREAGPAWVFIPEAPSLGRQPDGSASLSLLAVGDTHLLTLTGELAVGEDRLEQARQALAARHGVRPDDITLRPATLLGPRAAVWVVVDGVATEITGSDTSGIWPYTAAMQAMLTAPQADAVRAALAGHRGRVTLRYTAEVTTGEAPGHTTTTTTSSTSTSSTTTTTTRTGSGGTVTESSTTNHSDSDGHGGATAAPVVIAMAIDLDGADWSQQH